MGKVKYLSVFSLSLFVSCGHNYESTRHSSTAAVFLEKEAQFMQICGGSKKYKSKCKVSQSYINYGIPSDFPKHSEIIDGVLTEFTPTAICHRGTSEIYVNQPAYDALDDAEQQRVIDHELDHCVLGRSHVSAHSMMKLGKNYYRHSPTAYHHEIFYNDNSFILQIGDYQRSVEFSHINWMKKKGLRKLTNDTIQVIKDEGGTLEIWLYELGDTVTTLNRTTLVPGQSKIETYAFDRSEVVIDSENFTISAPHFPDLEDLF